MNLKNTAKRKSKLKRRLAEALGYCGLIPFFLVFILIFIIQNKDNIVEVIIIYSYMIITFLGGIYWGIALVKDKEPRKYFLVSIIPTILILFSLLFSLNQKMKLIYIVIFFNVFLLLELSYLKNNTIPKWFFLLRVRVNILLTLLLSFILINI